MTEKVHTWKVLADANRKMCGCGAIMKNGIMVRDSIAEEKNLCMYMGKPHLPLREINVLGYDATGTFLVCQNEHKFYEGDKIYTDAYLDVLLCPVCGWPLKEVPYIDKSKAFQRAARA
jgi:hypothetical protein